MVTRPDGLHEDELEIFVHDGARLREVLRLPRGPTYAVRTGHSGLTRPIPFGKATLLTAGPAGFVVGTSHDTVFRRFDEEGNLSGEYMARGSPRRVTAQDWEAFQDNFRAVHSRSVSLPGVGAIADPGPNVETFLKETPRGDSLPLFDALLVDRSARLWLREYSQKRDLATWDLCPLGGGVVGQVEVPRRWQVLEFGSDYVLTLERDEFDVETVRKYRMRP
jgi:hypothetical protein